MIRLNTTMQVAAQEIMLSALRLFFAVALISPASVAKAGTNSYSLGRASSPTNNPLKGFMPYAGS